MLKNSIRGVGVDKPSPIALLGKQTLTFEGLEEKNYDIWNSTKALMVGLSYTIIESKFPNASNIMYLNP